MPSTQPSDPLAAERENERREEIARIIDPDRWGAFDRRGNGLIAPLGSAVAEDYCKRSLTKADAILALPPLPQQGVAEPVAWRFKYPGWDDQIVKAKWAYRDDPALVPLSGPEAKAAIVESLYTRPAEAQARVEVLEAERDEAREIARVYAEHWPYGQRLARDEALRDALCAVPKPSARALLSGSTPKPALDWEAIADERGKVAADLAARLALARMTIENAVDTLNSRGRFGSPDDALASLQGTLDALRSGAPVTIPAKPAGVKISEEMVRAAVTDIEVVGTLFVARGAATARAYPAVGAGPDEHSELVRLKDVRDILAALTAALSGGES